MHFCWRCKNGLHIPDKSHFLKGWHNHLDLAATLLGDVIFLMKMFIPVNVKNDNVTTYFV